MNQQRRVGGSATADKTSRSKDALDRPTEVAWALGKIQDKRTIQPLYDLDKNLQAIRDPNNMALKKLKEAVFWAIKQCDTWDQYS
jgi:hypothetical protein